MDALDDVEERILRLSQGDRQVLAEWLLEKIGEKSGLEELSAAYGPAAGKFYLLTLEEFLAFEENSPVWHEYVAGGLYAMAEPDQAHEIIVSHLGAEIDGHLRGRPCRSYRGRRRVQFSAHGHDFVYRPDIWVACGEERDANGEFVDEPRLVIEVLSPSTEQTDRREKTLQYREIPTLEEIVLVSRTTPRVTILRRSQQWQPIPLGELAQTLDLESLGLSISLERIFEGLP